MSKQELLESAVADHEESETKKQFSFKNIRVSLSHLQGKVLTIIDASILEDRQNKAIKDLIKKSFNEQIEWTYKVATDFEAELYLDTSNIPTMEDFSENLN